MSNIGVYRESSLHASLKQLYAGEEYVSEVKVNGFVVDLFNGESIIEVQTGNFSHLRRKLSALLDHYRILIVYPIAVEKYIARVSIDGEIISSRKSPSRGSKFDIFRELVYIAKLLGHIRLRIEIVEIIEKVVWIDDAKGSWRRGKWSIHDHILVKKLGTHLLEHLNDYDMLPLMDSPFTTKDLAGAAGIKPGLARKMVYSLREMGLISVAGKKQRALLYQRTHADSGR